MKEIQKNASVLVIIAAISVTFLAFIKECTKEDYIQTMKIEENKTRKGIFPDATDFKKITFKNKKIYLAIKNGEKIGIIVNGTGKGFGGDLVVAVGVNLKGTDKYKIRGLQVLKHNETPGLGTKAKEPWFRNVFKNKNAELLPESKNDFKAKLGIDTIAGATITSMAMLNAIKNALSIAKIYSSNNNNDKQNEQQREKKSGGDTQSGATRIEKQSFNDKQSFFKAKRSAT